MTRQQEIMFRNWQQAQGQDTLYHLYEKPSQRKVEALEEIKREMRENNGHDLRVFNGNTFHYSCAYLYIDKCYNMHMVYHTAQNRHDFIIPNWL